MNVSSVTASVSQESATDTEAWWEQLVGTHFSAVYAAACRRLRDPALAEDATQAVFIAFWNRCRKGGRPRRGDPRPWLLRAARYVCRDLRKMEGRRQGHERKAAAMCERDGQWRNAPTTLAQPLAAVESGLELLPATERDILVARYCERQGLVEIAQALGVTTAAVKMRIARSTRHLRSIIHQYDGQQKSSEEMMIAAFAVTAGRRSPASLLRQILRVTYGRAAPSARIVRVAWKVPGHFMRVSAVAAAVTVTVVGASIAVPVISGSSGVPAHAAPRAIAFLTSLHPLVVSASMPARRLTSKIPTGAVRWRKAQPRAAVGTVGSRPQAHVNVDRRTPAPPTAAALPALSFPALRILRSVVVVRPTRRMKTDPASAAPGPQAVPVARQVQANLPPSVPGNLTGPNPPAQVEVEAYAARR